MCATDRSDFSLADTSTSWKRKRRLIFLLLSISSTTSSCLTSSLLNPPLNFWGKRKKTEDWNRWKTSLLLPVEMLLDRVYLLWNLTWRSKFVWGQRNRCVPQECVGINPAGRNELYGGRIEINHVTEVIWLDRLTVKQSKQIRHESHDNSYFFKRFARVPYIMAGVAKFGVGVVIVYI